MNDGVKVLVRSKDSDGVFVSVSVRRNASVALREAEVHENVADSVHDGDIQLQTTIQTVL